MIGKESPRLQNKLVGFREFESCVAKKVQLRPRVKERFAMQRCGCNDVNAVRRAANSRACTISYHDNSSLQKPLLPLKNPF